MKTVSTIAAAFAGLAVLVTAAGCSQKSTTATSQDTSKPAISQAVDDSTIQVQVKAKLTADRFANLAIDVDVDQGVVTLEGKVPTEEVKTEAAQEARSVDGVVRVVNNLQIEGEPAAS